MNENTKNSIKAIGFEFPTEGNWVYESPDGGKTITRRKMGEDISEREIVKDLSQLNFIMDDLKLKIVDVWKHANLINLGLPLSIYVQFHYKNLIYGLFL